MSNANEPLFSFGVIADVQYADAEPAIGRYYRASVQKLEEALTTLNAQPLSFTLDLGDLIDRNFASFDTVLTLYKHAAVPVHFTIGNHDYSVAEEKKDLVNWVMGLKPKGYYDFAWQNYRFIILNGNELSLFATEEGTGAARQSLALLSRLKQKNAANAREWNGGISDKQKHWLQGKLEEAEAKNQQVIVAGHYPLYPPNQHNLWNDQELVTILEQFPHVVAYFNGHNHAGNYGKKNGIHYLNFKGMVETEHENAFAVVRVYADRLEVQGYGREESRSLHINI